MPGSYHQRIYAFLRKLIGQGRQAYIVCPQVSQSDDTASDDRKAVTEYAKKLQEEVFPELKVAYVHGKMKPKGKGDGDVCLCRGGEPHSGVHHRHRGGGGRAQRRRHGGGKRDRFGLSQLHQLRGRVGRGQWQSYCILISDNRNEETRERLKVMTKTADGFKIAEEDLRLRGPATFRCPAARTARPQDRGSGLRHEAAAGGPAGALELLASDPELSRPPRHGGAGPPLFDQAADTMN